MNGKYLKEEKGFDIKKENEVDPYLAYDLKDATRISQTELNMTALPGNAWRTQKPYILRQSELTINV